MARYKNVEQFMYTETVYYDGETEVAREQNYDTHWYDTEESNVPLTEDEELDYFGDIE